jgi:acyl carrier protein
MSTDVKKLDAEDLRGFVADMLDVDRESVTDDAHFVAELGADSLKALEVLVGLERKYDIKISEDEVRDMTSFGEVRELVQRKLAG